MAEKIKIAELSINADAVLSELEATKKAIDKLTDAQKESKKQGDTNSKTYIQNEADLKTLRGEYNKQIKVLQATTGATEKLDKAIKKEVKSRDQAI
jgi:hypothetical protein